MSEIPTPLTDAVVADCDKDWGLSERHELAPPDYDEARVISTPTGAAVVVKHARRMERDRARLMECVKWLREDYYNFPHSLGYRITHLPKVDALLNELEADNGR